MLYKASTITLPAAEAALPAGCPWIGIHSVVGLTNIAATNSDTNFPASNLANNATNIEWRGATISPLTSTMYLTVDPVGIGTPIDYVAIARHNFGSSGFAVTIEAAVPASPLSWSVLVGPVSPTNDDPLMFAFTGAVYEAIRVKLTSVDVVPRAAVLFAGKLLRLERSVDIGGNVGVPRFARKTDIVSGRSARGDYLGTIVLSRYLEGAKFAFKHFSASWYRTTFDPFVLEAQSHHPFFIAWAPIAWPEDMDFVWFSEDPVATVSPITGLVDITLTLDGIRS